MAVHLLTCAVVSPTELMSILVTACFSQLGLFRQASKQGIPHPQFKGHLGQLGPGRSSGMQE